MKPADVASVLDRLSTMLHGLAQANQEISGFALIIPPEGEPIELTMIGSRIDARAFYAQIAEQMSRAPDAMGGVSVPGSALRMPR